MLKRSFRKRKKESNLSAAELLLSRGRIHYSYQAAGIDNFLKNSISWIFSVKIDFKPKMANMIYNPDIVASYVILQSPIFREHSSSKGVIIDGGEQNVKDI